MPFPTSEREVYEVNPLNEVICQIRYPTILKVAAERPFEFQDAVRGSYPLYEEKTPSIGLPPQLQEGIIQLMAALPLPVPPGLREHHFFTEDRASSISLTQEFIAVIESDYTRWEDFRGSIKESEETFHKIYQPAFYQRVGLRYVDILAREKFGMTDAPWSHLLNQSLIGMLGDVILHDEVRELTTEVLLSIPNVQDGFVRIKHGLATDQSSNEQVYLIDSDFFTNRRSDSDGALYDLDIFNRLGGYLFRWATTPELRNALGGKPL
jgi:uncharacterized protein (TIGR04255 family)